MDDAFYRQFHAEMDEFRKELRKDRLEGNACGCDARTQTGFRRERRSGEYHDKNVDFHMESGDKRLDESGGIAQESENGSL